MAVLVTILLPAATHRSPAWYATGQRRQRINLPTGESGRVLRPCLQSRGAAETRSLTFAGLVLGAAAAAAAQAGVQRAAESLVVKHRERVEADARFVVELTTVRDVTAPHRALQLLTVETRVNSWEKFRVQKHANNHANSLSHVKETKNMCKTQQQQLKCSDLPSGVSQLSP